MNRLRSRRGDGWRDEGNPVRAAFFAGVSALSVAVAVTMLLGVAPRAVLDGDGWLAIVAVVTSFFSVVNAWSLGRRALSEWRGSR